LSFLYPVKLPASFRAKIWGNRSLDPWFLSETLPENRIGEVWYSFEENRIQDGPFTGLTLADLIDKFGTRLMGTEYPPHAIRRRTDLGENVPVNYSQPYFPILSKLLFTSDRLSVQVHPDDEHAMRQHNETGKTEAWHIVTAEPKAQIALGLNETLSSTRFRHLATTGKIVDSLNWIDVKQGDTYFVAPGTVHALGPGLVICEIQQNSDLTYRIYDYGRTDVDECPRPLHIDQAVTASCFDEYTPRAVPPFVFSKPKTGMRRELLVACSHFAMEKISWTGTNHFDLSGIGPELFIFLEGHGQMNVAAINQNFPSSVKNEFSSQSCVNYSLGDAFMLPCEISKFTLHPETHTVAIRAYIPNLEKLTKSLQLSGATSEHLSMLIR